MTAAAKTPVRVRMAPSPTGFLHIGTARTALFNYLFAKQHNGVFMLRIEDTDAERSKTEYEIELIKGLHWLGLHWDEGPDYFDGKLVSKGSFSPYRQSERQGIYKKYAEQLLAEGKAYYCYCTKEELEAEHQEMLASGLPPKYSGRCRTLKTPPQGKNVQTIRFRTPEVKITFTDMIRGKIEFDAALFDDIIIARSDGTVLYNLAVVIDDHLMEITHVIRGEDHLSNTPKQILFQKALGFAQPHYAHIPLILNQDRSKLSKRKNKVSMLDFENLGYLPEAMVNFLALLGWHPKDDKEVLSLGDLIAEFDITRVQKGGAVFNQEKLDWLNSQHIKKLSTEELITRMRPMLAEKGIEAKPGFLEKVVDAERERLKTLGEFFEIAGFFFKLPDYEPKLLIWKNESSEKIKEIFGKTSKILHEAGSNVFVKDSLSTLLHPLTEAHGKGLVLWPLRVAVSGKPASPDPLAIMEILGKDETLRRITIAAEKLETLS